jgi:hypothetical protein
MKKLQKQKIVILSQGANNGELANQLWNYASIYAYALEKGVERLINNSFYEYGNFFANLQGDRTAIADRIFFKPFTGSIERKFSPKKKWYRRFYRAYSDVFLWLHTQNVVSSVKSVKIDVRDSMRGKAPYLLPPSTDTDPASKDGPSKDGPKDRPNAKLYFYGWLFRNPVGLTKYHEKIREHFAPTESIAKSTQSYIDTLRQSYKHVIGLHIRQGDYKTWQGGAYFIDQKRVRDILDEYLTFRKFAKNETCFVIATDGAIDESAFTSLNISITHKNMVEDLFILSLTDEIIGSNSTFGAFASYYGNISHIIMKKDTMDWEYYRDKKGFFENKYSTWVFFR